jgi:hypothetical protein
MDGSADRPAAAFADFVDRDRGITQDAAIAWLRVEYGLSEWAARAEFKRALASRNVPLRVTRNGSDRWEDISEYSEDEDGPINEELRLPLLRREGASRWERELLSREQPNKKFQGRFIRDRRYNADDLQWQIEKQLGKPVAAKAPKRAQKPDQKTLNEQFLAFAKKDGWKRKQNEDPEGAKFLKGLGATTRQIKLAYRYLADHGLAYTRGKH